MNNTKIDAPFLSMFYEFSLAATTQIINKYQVICVDLDGTLLHTHTERDLLRYVWPLWSHQEKRYFIKTYCTKGHLSAKRILAQYIATYYTEHALRMRRWLYADLSYWHCLGHKIYLVSGACQELVDVLRPYFSVFEDTFGSRAIRCVGVNKRRFITQQFANQSVVYIADAWVDHHVWQCVQCGIHVNAPIHHGHSAKDRIRFGLSQVYGRLRHKTPIVYYDDIARKRFIYR